MKDLFEKLRNKTEKVSVIGLGYVGLPLAFELSKVYDVVAFDINEEKLEQYKRGIDVTNEVGNDQLSSSTMEYSSDPKDLETCKFHIISVPTPINNDKTPNLNPVIGASRIVGKKITKGSIVVYESTVYPGTTEEICIPILEEESGLIFGKDFKVGYSPERINPGDKINTLTKIIKVVSGSDKEALAIISQVYESIIKAGVHKAETIKVAEASKVIENSQRDINIAFMNELSMVFNKMEINTNDVLRAAGTKWNFLKFQPGLVGGHCIGVDPYYFTYKAEQLGYHSQIILAGRKINDEMGKYVATNIIKQIIQSDQLVKGANVAILGITFKENVPDVRNTKVMDIIEELQSFGVNVLVHDPIANKQEVKSQYNIDLIDKENMPKVNAVVVAVPHKEFLEHITYEYLDSIFIDKKVLIDIKGAIERPIIESKEYFYWSL